MESTSGNAASTAPATQYRTGRPGRQNTVPSASPATACENADATRYR
jgi:hypothetical protein